MGRIKLVSAARRLRHWLAAPAPAGAKPFRPFFLLAALDAILGAGVWLFPDAVLEALPSASISASEWHRDLLLFAFVPAMLSGFLLTALPRWTRRPVSLLPARILFILSLFARAFFLLLMPAAGRAVAAFGISALTLVAGFQVTAAGDRRNLKVVALLALYAASAASIAMSFETGLALRAMLAAIVALMLIIGGRVVPALTASYVEHIGGRADIRRSPAIESAARIVAACALAAWVVAPQSWPTALASVLAAAIHLLRLAHWRGWQASASSMIALHVGYAWIAAGFILLAVHAIAPDSVSPAIYIHVWTAGGIGTMGLAVMASMIRRHSRRPFARSILGTTSFAAVTLSAISRLLAGIAPGGAELWMLLSASLWVAAFMLFLAAFRTALLPHPSAMVQVTPR